MSEKRWRICFEKLLQILFEKDVVTPECAQQILANIIEALHDIEVEEVEEYQND